MLRRNDLHRPNNSFELKFNSLFNFQLDCGPSSESVNYTALQFNPEKVVDSWFVAELITDPSDNTTRSVSKSVTRMPEHRPMLYILISLLVARKVDILCDKSFTVLRGARIDNTAKFVHFPFILDQKDVVLINQFRSLLFNLFYNIDFIDFTESSQLLIQTFYTFIEREREDRNPVKRDYIRDDSIALLSEDILSRWNQFAKFSTNQVDEGAPDFLAKLCRNEATSDLQDGFSFGYEAEEDQQTLLMRKQLQVLNEIELLAKNIQREKGIIYCKQCGQMNQPIGAVNSLEKVNQHKDYAFFLLFMLSTHNQDKLSPEDQGTKLAQCFQIVPQVESYIYCISKKHLLAVYTKQNRYVLHLDSPIGFAFPLIDGYQLSQQAKSWKIRLDELMSVDLKQQKARQEAYEETLKKHKVGGCFVCKGVNFRLNNPGQFVRHLLSSKHQKAKEEIENELALVL